MPTIHNYIETRTRTRMHPFWKDEDVGVREIAPPLHAKVVYDRHTRRSDEIESTTRTAIQIVFNRPATEREAYHAAYDMFATGGCDHEHDCCGCWHGGAYDLRKQSRNGRRWIAVLSFSRNY